MPVVAGIEKFAEAMAGHEHEYVLIGGAACSLLFEEAGESFRATKDLDVVVLVDDCTPEFGKAIWGFVQEGGYEIGGRGEGGCTYYRFTLPKGSASLGSYPGQIELFARHPDFILENEDSHIVPLPFDGTVSSLSAIILDGGYYEFIRENAISLSGVSTISALHIIPLKMRAHIDNNRLHGEGIRIQDKELKKHRSDVAKLAGLLSGSSRLALAGQLRADAEMFFDDFSEHIPQVTDRRKRAELSETLDFLKSVYL